MPEKRRICQHNTHVRRMIGHTEVDALIHCEKTNNGFDASHVQRTSELSRKVVSYNLQSGRSWSSLELNSAGFGSVAKDNSFVSLFHEYQRRHARDREEEDRPLSPTPVLIHGHEAAY